MSLNEGSEGSPFGGRGNVDCLGVGSTLKSAFKSSGGIATARDSTFDPRQSINPPDAAFLRLP